LIRQAESAADIAHARCLFEEYAAWLAVDLCFQGFAEELATLPGAYAPPRGRLLLAEARDAPVGCIALRPLHDDVGEVKRLYVKPAARGSGLGQALVQAILRDARAIGYHELKLDTIEWMSDARRLYQRLGFVECSPYYHNPLPGVVYMSLAL
jgi:GNAT superfamily N-acetyltransferase